MSLLANYRRGQHHALMTIKFKHLTLRPKGLASRVVLKILYTARLGRPDTLWSVNTLARRVTKWSKSCDKRFHRLIEYLKSTKDWVQLCFVGDHPQDCWMALFVDASFASDLEDAKSTNGAYLCIVGPRTFVPVTWVCKRQTAVSHSSTEAEVISLDAAPTLPNNHKTDEGLDQRFRHFSRTWKK